MRPLAVEAMLTESESHMLSGERNWDSGREVVVGLLLAMVNARVLGVGTLAEVGEVWNSPVPVMDAPGAGGTMVRLGPSVLARMGGCVWESARRWVGISTLAVAVLLGRAGAGGSAWFVRVREREEERETTLRTRSQRLPVDEEGVRVCALLVFMPRVFLNNGVGVGIPLPISSTEGSGKLTIEGGRF